MTKNAGELVVGANGSILTAPVGSALPASINDPLSVDYIDLGYVTEDGVTFTDGKTVEDVPAWQSFYAIRRIVTAREGTLAYSLMQWNGDTVPLAYGGGDITEDAPGAYRYTPPEPGSIDERMHVLEWEDGDKDYRLIMLKGMVTENVETNIVRTGPGLLPITFSLLGEHGVDPWVFQTNDPAFAAAVGSGS